VPTVMILLFASGLAGAADARYSTQQYLQRQQQLVDQAQREQQAAVNDAAAARQKIAHDRSALEKAVQQARARVKKLKKETLALKKQQDALNAKQQKLRQEKVERTRRLEELVGFIRMSARAGDDLLRHSQVNGLQPQRSERLRVLLEKHRFPGMDEVRYLRDLLLEEMRANGEVQITSLPILDRQGEELIAQVVVLGDFSAAYRSDDETGFLLYSAASGRFFALSVLPSAHLRDQLNDYFAGISESVPLDIGHGASLRQLTYRSNFSDQVRQGGVVVWPILAIGVIALLLIAERVWFLRRNSFDAVGLLQRLRPLIAGAQWQQCIEECKRGGDKPLPRVLRSGLRFHQMERDDLENALQEAILGEIPRLERFLSTLAVMASIAPLLGLLGTVTGMINTFQIITFHGTGDPRLMSGGISEALVTTMLGLGVAIPIMFSHSLLSRRVETIIAQLEEKSISFVNMVCQFRQSGLDQ